MKEKKLDDLFTTTIDDVIDALAVLYTWNYRGRKESSGQKGYPFERFDIFDLFFYISYHNEKEKIPKVLLSSFLDYVEEQEENIRVLMFDEEGDLYFLAVQNIVFSMEILALAKFYYKSEIDEEKLVELSINFENYDAYLEEHFWGSVGCDMMNSIAAYSN